jgi:Zn-finger nucleic acid-binding protein
MKCTACGNTLHQVTAGDLTVDVCTEGCGGIWFDPFELGKVDEKHESAGEDLLGYGRRSGVHVDLEGKRDCPRCEKRPMVRHFFSVKREVEVDECPGCGGFWLDTGELGKIRELYEDEEERTRAADEYFQEVFGEDLAAMREESEEKREKARKIAHMFRFICPSYYIPGKQDWGAF